MCSAWAQGLGFHPFLWRPGYHIRAAWCPVKAQAPGSSIRKNFSQRQQSVKLRAEPSKPGALCDRLGHKRPSGPFPEDSRAPQEALAMPFTQRNRLREVPRSAPGHITSQKQGWDVSLGL